MFQFFRTISVIIIDVPAFRSVSVIIIGVPVFRSVSVIIIDVPILSVFMVTVVAVMLFVVSFRRPIYQLCCMGYLLDCACCLSFLVSLARIPILMLRTSKPLQTGITGITVNWCPEVEFGESLGLNWYVFCKLKLSAIFSLGKSDF